MLRRLWHEIGRIRVRLLVVNVVVLLVPVAGLEFARLYERQLLGALERDMRNQAVLMRAVVEDDLRRGVELGDPRHQRVLIDASATTRMRVRLLDTSGGVSVDSHANGAPEGPEPPPPSLVPSSLPLWGDRYGASPPDIEYRRSIPPPAPFRYTESWPALAQRSEVREALRGRPSAITRVRGEPPGVFLFVCEPVIARGRVAGVVYVVRSTRPVLVELYRIRAGLTKVLLVALALTLLMTLLLAWSISRPLAKLSRAAKRIAAGEQGVKLPIGGGGEIRELGESFAQMREKLDARLAYISDFAADVAHEFKSPLTSIRGAAELLDEGAAEDPSARARFLQNISLDVARLDRLVSRLLELSRIEASSAVMVVFDLEAMARRVVERYDDPEHPVRLSWNAPARLLRGRETDLETALVNLVDNAARVSPAESPIDVTVEGGEHFYRITVRDRGPGIAREHLDKIFARFFTTDAERNGTGLGLAIVKSVAEAHGGRVLVRSEQGRGAAFTVELPARR